MLKDFIQWLLNTRTTPAEAAHSAMPKPENPTIISDVVTDKGWHSLIAPFDGYFSVKGISRHMLIENSSSQWQGITALTNAGYMGFTLLMSKGSEVRYQLDHETTGVVVSFSRVIGGGYNCLIKEVQLCLRTFFNSCWKLLSRVSTKILPTKLEASTQVLYTLPLPKESLDIPLQKLDTLPSEFLQPKTHGSELKMKVRELVTLQTQRVLGNIVQYLQRKGTQWYLTLAKVPTLLNALVTLFLVLPRHNRLVGGLPC